MVSGATSLNLVRDELFVTTKVWTENLATDKLIPSLKDSLAKLRTEQVDLALINANYALEAKLEPHKDALFIESSESPYANYLYVRRDKAGDPAVQKLGALLNSPQVKQFILERYHGDVVPAF